VVILGTSSSWSVISSTEWQMLVNVDSVEFLIDCRVIQAEYVMNNVKLQCVSEEKDLGVIVSDDLKRETMQCGSDEN